MTAPARGQRRRGTPSLVLPGDPDLVEVAARVGGAL